MIRRLGMRNFKSWSDLEPMRMAPITGLFGANSSGKTSILQLLLMLKQTVDSTDRTQVLNLGDDRTPVELGTFDDLLYSHEKERTLRWSISWKSPKPVKIPDTESGSGKPYSSRDIEFSAEVGPIAGNGVGQIIVHTLEYRLGDYRFRMYRGEKKGYRLESKQYKFRRSKGRAWPLPNPIKCYGFPDEVKSYFQNAGFLADLALAYEQLFARLYYLGPLREYPKRQYQWAGERPADMGQRGERVIDAILASRESKERIGHGARGYTLEEYIALWLQKLNLIDGFHVKDLTPGSNLYRVYIRKGESSAEVQITDVGFGVSQILPVIALCFYVEKGSTILLEQPEIHLHPAVQADLADVLIAAAKKRNVQIIVESHSEHLLRRFQRRIAEGTLNPKEDAAFYFCEMSEGKSTIRDLELDLLGNITNWPDDFFGDQYGEMDAFVRAQARKRMKATA